MAQKSLGIVGHYETEIILGGILIVAFWASTWGLIEEAVEYIHEKYQVKKVMIYISIFLAILLAIYMFPRLLDKV